MTNIKIEKTTLLYPNLFEPKGYQDGKPTFNTKALLHKKTHLETINTIKATIKAICEENKIIYKQDNFKCFKDGIDSGDQKLENYYVLTTKANVGRAPKIIGHDLESFIGTINSGATANLLISFWFYNYAGSKGVASNLKAVQYVDNGTGEFEVIEKLDVGEHFKALETQMPF